MGQKIKYRHSRFPKSPRNFEEKESIQNNMDHEQIVVDKRLRGSVESRRWREKE